MKQLFNFMEILWNVVSNTLDRTKIKTLVISTQRESNLKYINFIPAELVKLVNSYTHYEKKT